MRRILLSAGAALVLFGLLWPWLPALGLFGRMPGDLRIDRPGFTLFMPIGSSLLLSVVLSLLVTVLAALWRR